MNKCSKKIQQRFEQIRQQKVFENKNLFLFFIRKRISFFLSIENIFSTNKIENKLV